MSDYKGAGGTSGGDESGHYPICDDGFIGYTYITTHPIAHFKYV